MENARVKEMIGILRVVSCAPERCANCASFCQEGSISVPCGGDFHPDDCEYADEVECEERLNRK